MDNYNCKVLDKKELINLDSKINAKINQLIDDKELKLVNSEDEYWQEHKKYSKRLVKLLKPNSIYRAFKDTYNFLYDFELLISEMIITGVISEEYGQQQRERLYNELSKPSEFKYWIDYNKAKLQNAIDKRIKKEK